MASGRPNYAPVAMDEAGNGTAVWEHWDGTRYNIRAGRYSITTGWGAPQQIESNDGAAGSPAIAMDRNGNAMATWQQSDGVRNHVWAARYETGTGWGTAQRVDSDETLDAGSPLIAMDENGNAVVGWSAYDGVDLNSSRAWSNIYAQEVGWGTPTLLTSGDAVSGYPVVDMDSNGNAIGAWLQWDGVGMNMWANRFGDGIGWGTSQLIETNAGTVSRFAALAVHPCGSAMAVWPQSDGASSGSVWVTRFE